MMNWFIDDVLKNVLPRTAAALIALGVAHSDTVSKWGITVDWNTLSGKLTSGVAILVGLLAAHHTVQKVQGGPK